ncbi:hypothetical protein [Peribacillus sp. CSMR9]|nr:hypothetical protein [Peribacillus sp. CSMR9]
MKFTSKSAKFTSKALKLTSKSVKFTSKAPKLGECHENAKENAPKLS